MSALRLPLLGLSLLLLTGIAGCRSARIVRAGDRAAATTIAKPVDPLLAAGPTLHRRQSLWDDFVDDQDGNIDLSDFMSRPGGFLPVVVPITEPAVGYGATFVAAIFHPQNEPGKRGPSGQRIAPAISAVGGFATENGTWGALAAHMNNWKDDRIRYSGALFHASANLTYYGTATEVGRQGAKFNIQGSGTIQDVQFRLGNSAFFAGVRYQYFKNTVGAENMFGLPGLEPTEFVSENASVAFELNYDTRDNTFTPSKGYRASAMYSIYDDAVGGDFDYYQFDIWALGWFPLGRKWNLGVRLEGQFVQGAAPFYAQPFINLRGIPAMRYQGDDVVVGETELRYDFNSRWSVVGFTGAGRAARTTNRFWEGDERSVVQTAWSAGAGFRYLVSRLHGLRMGIDVARGPEDWAFYVTVGNAWNRL